MIFTHFTIAVAANSRHPFMRIVTMTILVLIVAGDSACGRLVQRSDQVTSSDDVSPRRRSIIDTMKDQLHIGGKKGRNDRALAKIQDPSKHTTARTLDRLNTDNFARLAPAYADKMDAKEAIRVGKTLNKHIHNHSNQLANKVINMDSRDYKTSHYSGKEERDMRQIVHKEFGRDGKRDTSTLQTKLMIHEDVQKHQDKLNKLEPTHNVVGSKLLKADLDRHGADKSRHPSDKKILAAHQRQVDMRGMLDPQFKANVLHLQNQRLAQRREGLSSNAHYRSDLFTNRPHKSADSTVGGGSSRTLSSREGDSFSGKGRRPHRYVFEGKENHAALNKKLGPIHAYSDEYRVRPAPATVTTHEIENAKKTPTLIKSKPETTNGRQTERSSHRTSNESSHGHLASSPGSSKSPTMGGSSHATRAPTSRSTPGRQSQITRSVSSPN